MTIFQSLLWYDWTVDSKLPYCVSNRSISTQLTQQHLRPRQGDLSVSEIKSSESEDRRCTPWFPRCYSFDGKSQRWSYQCQSHATSPVQSKPIKCTDWLPGDQRKICRSRRAFFLFVKKNSVVGLSLVANNLKLQSFSTITQLFHCEMRTIHWGSMLTLALLGGSAIKVWTRHYRWQKVRGFKVNEKSIFTSAP